VHATNGAFTSGANTVTFDSLTTNQTIDSGGIDADHDFNNITHLSPYALRPMNHALVINGTLLLNEIEGVFDATFYDQSVTIGTLNLGWLQQEKEKQFFSSGCASYVSYNWRLQLRS